MSRRLLSRRGELALLGGPVLVLALFFLWPLAVIARHALSAEVVRRVLGDPATWRLLWFTTAQAVASAAATMVVAFPMTWAIARRSFRGRSSVLALLTVPFMLPTVVVAAAFLALLPARLIGTPLAIVIAHVFFNYAVVVRLVGGAWAHLDPRATEAARSLGATPFAAFRSVTAPLLRPALLGAAGLVFLFSFTSFGIVLLLGDPRRTTIEVEIYRRTTEELDLGGAALLAVLQLGLVLLLLAAQTLLGRRLAVPQRLRRARETARPARTARERTALAACLLSPALLLGVPVARLVEQSLRGREGGFGLGGYRAIADPPHGSTLVGSALRAALVSLRYALAAGAIALVLGLAVSLVVVHGSRLGRSLELAYLLPLGTSAVTVGLGFLLAFDTPPLDLRSSAAAVPLAHALVAVPFVVAAILPVLRSIDPRLRDAARVLGASPLATLVLVDLRLCLRSALSGLGFAFAISLGEFGASSFLVRPDQPTLPIAIGRLASSPSPLLRQEALALAVVLAAVTAAVLLACEALRSRDRLGL